MRASYTPGNIIQLPDGHPFPIGKYEALHRILLEEGLIRQGDALSAEEAGWETLRLVHTPEYLDKLEQGSLTRKEERRLGLPWSELLLRRARVSVQGTVNAARMALEDGIAASLGGGTHHAFPDHGEGFCTLNDVAVAIRLLQRDDSLGRALVIDLDVHQGNGTAAIFEEDDTVYTFSMHGERNYPFQRQRSSRDVDVPDGASADVYLDLLNQHLPEVLDEAQPDFIFYLAGVDPVEGDRFGRLNLTRAGLQRRERTVLRAIRESGCPAVLLVSGGYAPSPEISADLHAVVHREAARVFAEDAVG
jgi:acetoin utilization deacetylase AcuC-like enzyme